MSKINFVGIVVLVITSAVPIKASAAIIFEDNGVIGSSGELDTRITATSSAFTAEMLQVVGQTINSLPYPNPHLPAAQNYRVELTLPTAPINSSIYLDRYFENNYFETVNDEVLLFSGDNNILIPDIDTYPTNFSFSGNRLSFDFTEAATFQFETDDDHLNGFYQFLWPGPILIDAQLPIEASRLSYSLIVSSIPEPQTWAMLLMGFGLAGSALRLKRSSRKSQGKVKLAP